MVRSLAVHNIVYCPDKIILWTAVDPRIPTVYSNSVHNILLFALLVKVDLRDRGARARARGARARGVVRVPLPE